jgi:hypothetical protein
MEKIYFWSGFGILGIIATAAGAGMGALAFAILADCFGRKKC